MTHHFFHILARYFPQTKLKLRQAEINSEPHEFIKQVFTSAAYLTIGVGFALFLMFAKFDKSKWILLVVLPLFFIFSFWYLTKLPDLKILKEAKEIDKEIVFAGKFLIIELNSGIPLHQVLMNIAENYGGIGRYFKKIVDDIDLGTETEDAINNAILTNPSDNFRKVLWQLSNSLRTGADISHSLDSVLDQIGRKQIIEVERYGKKLNPIAMFYLMMAVIIPSLGMVMGVVFASFVNIHLPLAALLVIAILFGFFQFMFYATIKSNRPAVEM
jgi:pilus assembly protein TadC